MNRRIVVWVVIAGLATACAPMSQLRQSEEREAVLEEELARRERALEVMEGRVERLEGDLERESRTAPPPRRPEPAREPEPPREPVLLTNTPQATQAGEALPPDAKPGECYARVLIPPRYEKRTERVLKREPSQRVEIVPAQYETVAERVVLQEATTRYEVVPPTYEWIEEKVLVKPATTRKVDVPAEYRWTEEKILVKPAQKVWKKGRGAVEKIDHGTGEIMCLVEEPAVYETVAKQVVVKPAGTRTVEVPAEYRTIRKKVVTAPATTRAVEIPAEYGTVEVERMTRPEEERILEIPAEYETVTKSVMVEEGRAAWRPVLCETNMSRDVILDLQRALSQHGHAPGPIDGAYGRQTRAAVRQYQLAQGLPTGGLTMATLARLGVIRPER